MACAFSLCASLHKQESHPIFPSGPHSITEPHLFLWHWQYGSKRKIPSSLECLTVGYQSPKTSCLQSALGKQSSTDSSAKQFFGRLAPSRIKDVGSQPGGQAGTGPRQDTGILVEREILYACLYRLLTFVLKGELPKT